MHPTLRLAKSYLKAGLGIIPIKTDGSKAPALPKGHKFLKELPTEADLEEWFASPPFGVAIPGGKVSGNLECLDFERWDAFAAWRVLIAIEQGGILDRLNVCETPGRYGQPGAHVRYRVDGIVPGNEKLASIYKLDAGGKRIRRKDGRYEIEGLIETRGEGGYALAPGSPKSCHPSGRTWLHVGGPPLTELQTLTMAERNLLVAAAASLNVVAQELDDDKPSRPGADDNGRLRPGDDFNRRGPSFESILEEGGWKNVGAFEGATRWRRPGKDRDWSATLGACRGEDGEPLFYVFSSNAEPFQTGKAYSKFRTWATLNHKGNLREAARILGDQGFGEKRPQRDPVTSGKVFDDSDKVIKAREVISKLKRPSASNSWRLNRLMESQFADVEWIVEGLVPDAGLTFLGGKKKLGKSWLCLQMAQGVASGAPVLSKSTLKGPVVYLALEDGPRRIQDRFRKQKADTSLDIEIFTTLPPLDTDEGWGEFVWILERRPRLVILDTFAAAKSGKSDENDAGVMGDMAYTIKGLAHHYGVAVLVTHHHGKVVCGDPGDDLRGSSSLSGAADLILGIYAEEGERSTLKGIGRDIAPFEFAIQFDPKSTWCWQLLGDAKTVEADEVDTAFLAALGRMEKADVDQLAELIGRHPNRVRDRAARLIDAGKIEVVEEPFKGRGRPRLYYRLKHGDSWEG